MPEWQDWIGRTRSATQWLDPLQADRMAATLDRTASFRPGDVLPPAWHWLYFHDLIARSELGGDGHPRLGVTMPPVGLPRRMWAGGRLEFRHPVILGRQADRLTTISDVVAKDGRSGPLVFVTVRNEIRQDGLLCVLETQTIVYRPESSAGAEPAAVPTSDVDFTRSWQMDATALFRYSALTFNGHRIHYDADYARDVEGYPGLVVHGPLLATLLLDLLMDHRRPMSAFAYRARSPVFAGEAFSVNGRRDGQATHVWVCDHHGALAMDGHAE